MRRLILSGVALLAFAGSASAAELTGRITHVNPDDNLLFIDSGDQFTLGSGVDKTGLLPGLKVKVTYEGSGEQMTATAVDIIEPPAQPVVGAAGAPAGAAGGADAAAGGAGAAAGGAAGGAAAGGAAAGGAAGGAMGVAPAAPGAPAAPAP
jgi:hypothetical protein